MKRTARSVRGILSASLALGAALLGAGSPGCWNDRDTEDSETGSTSPDIVLVIVDTLRTDHLSTYGYERATSPTLDQLAKRALVFEQAYAASGWTLPSTASLLTGLTPSRHGAHRDPFRIGRRARGRLNGRVPVLGELLGHAGYRTACFANNPYFEGAFGLSRGFQHYSVPPADNRRHRTARATVERALDWLKPSDQQAFVLVHFMEPHLNYAPPHALRGAFGRSSQLDLGESFGIENLNRLIEQHVPNLTTPIDRVPPVDRMKLSSRLPGAVRDEIERMYDEEIVAADRALDDLLKGLERRGRPYWLFFTADHGEEFWDHGSFEHGHQLHGELLRIPLVIAGPARTRGRVAAPVSYADVFRTILDIGGASLPPTASGLDLRSVAREPGGAYDMRPIVHEDCLYGSWCAAITKGRYRLIVRLPEERLSLFAIDEHGQNDTPVEEPAVMRELRDELYALRGETAPRLEGSTTELSPDQKKRLLALGYIRD